MFINTNNVYIRYGLFILFKVDILFIKIHVKFVSAKKVIITVKNNLDCCGYINNSFHFCKSYYGIIIDRKISKFRFANFINIWFCEKYPNVFSNLTFVKKKFIVCIYLII